MYRPWEMWVLIGWISGGEGAGCLRAGMSGLVSGWEWADEHSWNSTKHWSNAWGLKTARRQTNLEDWAQENKAFKESSLALVLQSREQTDNERELSQCLIWNSSIKSLQLSSWKRSCCHCGVNITFLLHPWVFVFFRLYACHQHIHLLLYTLLFEVLLLYSNKRPIQSY